MDTTDTSPLLLDEVGVASTEEEEEEAREKEWMKDLVQFHGRELGGSKSILHNNKPLLVKVAIGKQGVYKLDSKGEKVLTHWRYDEIKDWSYSGYSLTLQLQTGGHHSLRTDDGEAICSCIDSFQKDPTEALKQARANPPNSMPPDVGSGIRTLRRKFSGDVTAPPPLPEPMFYTLNRRTKKKPHDPTARLTHNIEVDSRLRTAYGQAGKSNISPALFMGESRNRSTSNPIEPTHENNVSCDDKKQHAREVLNQTIGLETTKEKRLSNGVVMSPVSTRGEATKGATTEPTRLGSPPAHSLPPPTSKPVSPPQAQTTEGKKAEVKPVTNVAESAEPVAAPSPSKPSRSEERPPEAISARKDGRPREVSPSDSESSEASSNEATPLLRIGSTSSSSENPFSPTEGEFEYVSLDQHKPTIGTNECRPPSSTSSNDSHYDTLEKIQESIANRDSKASVGSDSQARLGSTGSNDLTPKLSSPLKATKTNEVPYALPLIVLRRDSQRSSSSSSDSIYDHLSPLTEIHQTKTDRDSESPPRIKVPAKFDVLPSPIDFSVRRNVSQPALSMPGSARGTPSPSPSLEVGTVLEQSGSEYEEEMTPTNSGDELKSEDGVPGLPLDPSQPVDLTNVVLRKKKRAATDPFADILGSPAGVSRLRWSQELNPLYDYIKGVKVLDSVTLDLRLYDMRNAEGAQSSSTPKKKPPSVIVEESELSEVESVASLKDLERSGSTASSYSQDSFPEASPSHRGYTSYHGREKIRQEDPLESASQTLPRLRRPQHAYEDVQFESQPYERPASQADIRDRVGLGEKGLQRRTLHGSLQVVPDASDSPHGSKSMTMTSLNVRRLKTWDKPAALVISPRLGKRELQQRRSRTLACMDDTETVKRKQRAISVKGLDELKDFAYAMREYRLFFIKMPTGKVHREVFNINKQVSELREKLCDLLGVDNPDNYMLYVEGAVLTSLKETDVTGEVTHTKFARSGSLSHLLDNQYLPDQGADPILLKSNLSLRMQGITTSRLLSLMSEDMSDSVLNYPSELPTNLTSDFHNDWVGVVQGNIPCSQDDAVKLAALQYQAYVFDRTAVHSVVEFCRPTEFLPCEYANVRGIEQKIYKEQEKLRLRTHKDIQEAYTKHCSEMESSDTVFYPCREPRKKLLQSTKLKPILLGVGSHGIMRLDPKTKEVLDLWEFQVLKNWAYSRRTFVVAFANKNYPVECNQAKWISELVDYYVESIVNSPTALSQILPQDGPTS